MVNPAKTDLWHTLVDPPMTDQEIADRKLALLADLRKSADEEMSRQRQWQSHPRMDDHDYRKVIKQYCEKQKDFHSALCKISEVVTNPGVRTWAEELISELESVRHYEQSFSTEVFFHLGVAAATINEQDLTDGKILQMAEELINRFLAD